MLSKFYKNKKVKFEGGPLHGEIKVLPKNKRVYCYKEVRARAVFYHAYFMKDNTVNYGGVLIDRRKHE